MSKLWSPEEDRILMHGYSNGLSDRKIVDVLSASGFPRGLSSVQHRREYLRLYRVQGSKPSSWAEDEDDIIKAAALSGKSGREMAEALSAAGYRRSADACLARATRIGARDCHDAAVQEKTVSDPLADALRKAGAREGIKRSLYDNSVPARAGHLPQFSLTGSQF